MSKPEGLRFDLIGGHDVHFCADAQRLFAEDTEWHMPWLLRVLANVERIVQAEPERTIFTRFIPTYSAEGCGGAWRRYYERWSSMTLDALPREKVELVPSLARFVPPARDFDECVYSPRMQSPLNAPLRDHRIVGSGGEADVCLLSTIRGAIHRHHRVVVTEDAVCSSADDTYDATMTLYGNCLGEHIESASTDEIPESWR